MIRRLPCQMTLAFLAGIVFARSCFSYDGSMRAGNWNGLILVGLFLWHLLLFIICGTRKTWKKACFLGICLEMTALVGTFRMWDVSEQMSVRLQMLTQKQQIAVQGMIVQKQKKNNQWTVLLKDCHLKTSKGLCPGGSILLTIQAEEPQLGSQIIAEGTVRLFQQSRNDGNFNEKQYYQDQGIICRVYGTSMRVVSEPVVGVRERLYKLQQMLGAVFRIYMPDTEAGVLNALLIGEKGLLSEEIKLLYRRSGMAHILAISGLHISILGTSLYRLLRKKGCSYWKAAAGASFVLLAFGCMTGMGISIKRAIFMFLIYLGAQCLGRCYDRKNALALAALLILAGNPRILFLSGFLLSFGAVIGVMAGQMLCELLRPRFKIIESIMISFGIQLVTMPIFIWNYYELPVYSMVLNLFVLPFLAVILLAGLFGGAFGILCASIGALTPVFGFLASKLLFFVTLLLMYMKYMGTLFLNFPGSVYISGCPGSIQVLIYYILLGIGYIFVSRLEEKKQKVRMLKRNKYFPIVLTWSMMLLVCLFVRLPEQGMIAVLDVGQGDGIYIQTPEHYQLFIDGGSTDIKGVGTYRILPFLKYHGVERIDYWFLSHLDKDHVSGMEEAVEEGYPIRFVVLAEEIVKDAAYDHLCQILEERGIPILYMRAGDRIQGSNFSMECLLPVDTLPEDRNGRSLVLLYEAEGKKALFSGDISAEQEKLLQTDEKLKNLTFWKAAHHGSNYSNSEAFLEWMTPDFSVISCAKENDYGHPGKEAVEHMKTYSGYVFYTMESGCVKWTKGGVEEYLKEKGDSQSVPLYESL